MNFMNALKQFISRFNKSEFISRLKKVKGDTYITLLCQEQEHLNVVSLLSISDSVLYFDT